MKKIYNKYNYKKYKKQNKMVKKNRKLLINKISQNKKIC